MPAASDTASTEGLARPTGQAAPWDAAARAFRAGGGKVVGLLSHHAPRELVLAAGMFPLLLRPDPADDTPVADRYMEAFFDGPIRSLFDRLLTGQFDFVDLVVIPRSSEGLLQLHYFVDEVRRWEPARRIPDTCLFDVLHTPFHATGRYVRGRMDDLRQRLAQLAGRAIAEAEIARAIREVNAQQRLLAAVNALRRGGTPRLSGAEALRIFAGASQMHPAEHAALLQDLLAQLRERPPRPGTRVMVKGSPHDTTRFYDLVETGGGVVVADDHLLGERMIEGLAEEDVDPMAALTQKYHLRVPGIRSYPQAAQDRRFLDIVDAAAVQAVIFYHEEHDDTLGWDYPDQKRALDARGIPSLFLRQQSYRTPDQAAQRDAVVALLQRVASGVAA